MKQTFGKLALLIALFLFTGIVGLSAQQQAKPQSGEGIRSFLERMNRPGKRNYDAFVALNRKKLGEKVQLQRGVSYALPPLAKVQKQDQKGLSEPSKRTSIHEPLFGKALADVKITSSKLSGACFYVVSGHGGPDPGAIGKVGNIELHEDEYAYDIALRLARNLMQEGAQVHIIIQDAKDGIREEQYLANSKRETCMGDRIPLNQVKRLQQRCDKINAYYKKDRKRYTYCRAIFIHVDSRSKKQQTDVFFYHSIQKTDSKQLAQTMKRTFESKYGTHQPDRGFTGTVNGRNLFVMANAKPVSVFVELGNIQNTFDQQRFVMSSNRQALAKWLTEGFIKDRSQQATHLK